MTRERIHLDTSRRNKVIHGFIAWIFKSRNIDDIAQWLAQRVELDAARVVAAAQHSRRKPNQNLLQMVCIMTDLHDLIPDDAELLELIASRVSPEDVYQEGDLPSVARGLSRENLENRHVFVDMTTEFGIVNQNVHPPIVEQCVVLIVLMGYFSVFVLIAIVLPNSSHHVAASHSLHR